MMSSVYNKVALLFLQTQNLKPMSIRLECKHTQLLSGYILQKILNIYIQRITGIKALN